MPRVNTVEKARKDYPNAGIKKGDKYYWWKFRYGGKHMSKTYPKQSQLTQSNYLSQLYDLQDRISDFTAGDIDELTTQFEDIKSEIENLKDETESSLQNMPDQLQYSPTGELLQERIDALGNAISELDGIDLDDYEEPDEDEIRDELKNNVDYTPTEEEEAEEDYDYDEKRKELVTDEDIEEYKSDKLQEWLDEKISEIQSISLEG